MIIVGYPGVGKSTYAKKRGFPVYDLESSYFRRSDGTKPENWADLYTQIALHMSSLGMIVCTSSHYDVRQRLNIYNDTIYNKNNIIIGLAPSVDIKDGWIDHLKNRYESSKLEKDKAAYLRAKYYFESDIKDIAESCKYIYYLNHIPVEGNEDLITFCIQDAKNKFYYEKLTGGKVNE